MRLSVVIFLLSVSLVASAKTIVVSDIDDTLKESYVRWGWGSSQALSLNAMWGMADLLRALAAKPDVKVFYVSMAPAEIMWGRHTKFLTTNAFPAGEMRLPYWSERDGFKRKQILDIIAREAPTDVLLFGDNGEQDAEIYDGIVRELAGTGIRFQVFIHEMYSRFSLGHWWKPGQVPYVTAGMPALHLAGLGMLPIPEARAILNVAFLRPGREWSDREARFPGITLGFPDWMDCRDLQAVLPRVGGLEIEAARLEEKIRTRCRYVVETLRP